MDVRNGKGSQETARTFEERDGHLVWRCPHLSLKECVVEDTV